MLAFVGPCPAEHSVEHLNTVRHDNRLVNLCYLPVSQNSYEANMRRYYGPVRTDWAAWEADSA
jgi:hypothetical protein